MVFRMQEIKKESDNEDDSYVVKLKTAPIPDDIKKHLEDAFVYDVCFLLLIILDV